jgi:CDP-diacylglycerol--glycerol-3-phosphate 3-phosphatidyltransferase
MRVESRQKGAPKKRSQKDFLKDFSANKPANKIEDDLIVINAANTLTMCRLVSVVPILFLVNRDFENHFIYAAIVFSLSFLTDALDGFLARKLNRETEFGGFLDATTDKIVIYTVLFSLFQKHVYLYYVIFPIFFRDILVDSMRSFSAKKGVVLSANRFGKLKMALQFISACIGLLYLHFGGKSLFLYVMSNITLGGALAVSMFGIPVLYKGLKKTSDDVVAGASKQSHRP